MKLINNRNLYILGLILTFSVVLIFIINGVSKIFVYLNQGADRASILHKEDEAIDLYLPEMHWDIENTIGRQIQTPTLKSLERDYLFSWYTKYMAFKTHGKDGLKDFYTDSSRVSIERLVNYNKINNIHFESTTLKHHPKVEFYSTDGQQIALTDHNVIEYQKVYKNDQLIQTVQDTSSYRVVLLLEDGFWRIRQLLKQPKELIQPYQFTSDTTYKIKDSYENQFWQFYQSINKPEKLLKDNSNTTDNFKDIHLYENQFWRISQLLRQTQTTDSLVPDKLAYDSTYYFKNKYHYENQFWRISQLLKQTTDSLVPKLGSDTIIKINYNKAKFRHINQLLKSPKKLLKPHPFPSDTTYNVKDKHIYKNGIKFKIKGINYYPKNSPWDMYGDLFDPDTIAHDFSIIKKAKLNTIRIFVPYFDFGSADVDIEKIQKLKQVLDIAEKEELSVILTLFDFYSNYEITDWTLTHRHAEKVLKEFSNHPAIIAWDIKNEPDLDFENRGKRKVLDWLDQMITLIKEKSPNQLVTIGWSNPDDAVNLKDRLSFISYHYYRDIENFKKQHSKLNNETPKPIVLQEFGVSSYKGFWNLWLGYNQESQAEFHQKIQTNLKELNAPFLSWTLYDFEDVPNEVVGIYPWRKKKQKFFGFIDKKGRKKPSFLYITHN